MKSIRILFLDVNNGFGLAAGNFRSSKGYGNLAIAFPQSALWAIVHNPVGTLKTISIRNSSGLPAGIAVCGFENPTLFLTKTQEP